MTDHAAAIAAATKCLDDFMAAFNARDPEAHVKTFNFPSVRFASGKMVILNTDTGAIVATVPIGAGTDAAAFDPARKLAFSSNGDGTLSVIREKDANTFVALAPIKTAISARTMTIDPKTGRLFLAAADIAKIDPPAAPGGRPHVEFVPGSLKLLVFDPSN